ARRHDGPEPRAESDDTAHQPMTTRTPTSRRSAAGFTLVEILVALLILAIMAALGYSTYRAARISAERTEESLKRSREIEFGMRIMVADFAQLVPRPVRDILGQTRLPALRGTQGAGSVTATSASLGANSSTGSSSSSGLSFNSDGPSAGMSFNSGSGLGGTTDLSALAMVDLTRAGWSNTAGQQRSTLQRVSYALVGDVLKRSYQTNLDTVQGNKPVVQDLLTGVKGVRLRYLDGNQAWQTQWPESTTIQNSSIADLQSRPVAIEIIIQFKDWGAIRRLVEVSG
ncbi:MAG TPA: type II secretion system minor pseudopilin GspJ, partial [Steroidobacteraceae bacterium]|nr:type II secretion system minor pseudopilin GspJ [Steroidobacteraceae bacterium]